MTKAFQNGNEDFAFFVKSLKMQGCSLVWKILRKYNFTWIDYSTFKKLIYIIWAGIVKKLFREGSIWSSSLESVIWNFLGCLLSIFGVSPQRQGRFPHCWTGKVLSENEFCELSNTGLWLWPSFLLIWKM